ncbi:MAG: GNAT family N-acetyltransferase [Xanthomonadales bacterium]|nr:GNAT family N-acetyltransferase [Xanthomonadales bacterium]
MKIEQDDLTGPEIAVLLREHLAGMHEHSPPESIHALDLPALQAPDITFWSAWGDEGLLGCAALKQLDTQHGEIKSMRTARQHLGKGVASALLRHLIAESRRRGYGRLSLETGSSEAFVPALRMYEKFGFQYCGPFAQYREDPFSRFMTLEL